MRGGVEAEKHAEAVRVGSIAAVPEVPLSTSPTCQSQETPAFQHGIINVSLSRFLGRGSDEALFSGKKGFSVKRGRDSVNEGFGKDFYRKGNSVKRSGPFSEPRDSEN